MNAGVDKDWNFRSSIEILLKVDISVPKGTFSLQKCNYKDILVSFITVHL